MVATILSELQKQPSSSTISSINVEHLSGIFETLLEQLFPAYGLALMDENGRLMQSSPKVRKLCHSLGEGTPKNQLSYFDQEGKLDLLTAVHVLCKTLRDSRSVFADKRIQLQEDILLEDSTRIRLNAEWIQLGAENPHHILIIIEDLTEASRQRALSDAYRYNLTPREMEVWELSLQGFTYRQISEKLFIAINTVKKHMKTIHSKRRLD